VRKPLPSLVGHLLGAPPLSQQLHHDRVQLLVDTQPPWARSGDAPCRQPVGHAGQVAPVRTGVSAQLLARPIPPRRVVFTGSGTHDPARRSGMPAPLEGNVASWARAGDGDEPPATAGRRRYTTSKLLNTATAAALARERPDVHVTCFDPGLMLGTGLSRQYPPMARRLTTWLAPVLALAPFASTPQRSGAALSRLLLEEPSPAESGAYLDYRLHTLPASTQARDQTFQDTSLHDSRQLLTPWASHQS